MKLDRLVALLLCVCFLIGAQQIQAEPLRATDIASSLDYSNTNFVAFTLDITTSGKVNVYCTVSARNCTGVGQSLRMQMWYNGAWRDYENMKWNHFDQGTLGYFSDSSKTVGIGSFRVMNTISIYDGSSIVEQFDLPSNTVIVK